MEPIQDPRNNPLSSLVSVQETATQIRAALATALPRTPGHGQPMLFIALVGQAVLLFVYMVCALAVAGAVVWHFAYDYGWMLKAQRLGGHLGGDYLLVLAAAFYLAVGALAVLLLLLLCRPCLVTVQPAKSKATLRLTPAVEPAVHALVHRLSDILRTRRPDFVQVDCGCCVTLSQQGQERILTLGLPLAASLSVRQLAGLLANELAAHSEARSTRQMQLVHQSHGWFTQAAQGEDMWEPLIQKMAQADGLTGWSGRGIRFLSRGARAFLAIFAKASTQFSRSALSQWDFDSDAMAAQIVSNRELIEAQLRRLTLQQIQDELASQWQQSPECQALPACAPSQIRDCEKQMTEATRLKLLKSAPQAADRPWKVRPNLGERQRKLSARQTAGVFQPNFPAEEIFSHFAELSQAATRLWYSADLGLDLNRVALVNPSAAVQQQAVQERYGKAMRELFGQLPPTHRLLPLPSEVPDHAVQVQLVERWKSEYATACQQEEQLRHGVLQQTLVYHLRHLGFPAAVLGLCNTAGQLVTLNELQKELNEASQGLEKWSAQMQVFEQAAWSRISAALALRYAHPQTPQSWQQRLGLLVAAQRAVASAAQVLHSCWGEAWLVDQACRLREHYPPERNLDGLLRIFDRRVGQALAQALQTLSTTTDPTTEPTRRLSDAVNLPALPSEKDFHSLLRYGPTLLALDELASHIVGELSLLTLETERSWQAAPANPAPVRPSAEPEHSASDWTSTLLQVTG